VIVVVMKIVLSVGTLETGVLEAGTLEIGALEAGTLDAGPLVEGTSVVEAGVDGTEMVDVITEVVVVLPDSQVWHFLVIVVVM